jgi:hypothetical protein
MALYNFGIPSFRIHDTRSLLKDTLVGSMSLRVSNAQGGLHHVLPDQTVNLGDHEKVTTVQTTLLYQDVDVPDPTPDLPDGGSITWGFLLVNKGHPNSDFVDLLKGGVDVVVQKLAEGVFADPFDLPAWVALAGALGLKDLLSVLFADCDGPVAVLGLSLTAAELAQMTADPNNSLNSILCPGIESPAGCGSNSKYTVVYRIINNNSLITVPDLVGKSPEAATALAQQAGLGISIINEPTGPKNQRPTVDNQFPDPGSRVPPGSSVEAFVIVPSRTGVPL